MHPSTFRCILVAVIVGLLTSHALLGSDWPQFLGPNRNGISAETGLNWDWARKPPKTLWKVPLGAGYSSVAVAGDRIYTAAKKGERDLLVCLDAKDGHEVWSYDAAPSYLDMQKQGAGPRATPTVYQGKVYALFGMGELVGLTTDGKRVWDVNVFKDTGTANPAESSVKMEKWFYWGVSYSPLIEGDLVIVMPGGKKGSAVAAYHRENGKRVWTAGDDPFGYASPIAISAAGRRAIICATGQSVLGIEPTKGSVLFRHAFGNQFNATAATPVWKDNVLFVSAAYGGGSAALELTPGNDAWQVRELWRNKKSLQTLMATPIVQDGFIYSAHGDLSAFQVKCVDLKTGDVKWSDRAGEQRCALLGVDGRLLVWGEKGSLLALNATPEAYTVEAELPGLLKYKSWAMPALADGRLYLRDQSHLLCLDLRRKPE